MYELQTEIYIHPLVPNKDIVFFLGKFIFAHILEKVCFFSPRKKLHLRLRQRASLNLFQRKQIKSYWEKNTSNIKNKWTEKLGSGQEKIVLGKQNSVPLCLYVDFSKSEK